METKFKTGDIVRLKSGGPKMTVNGYTPYGQVECVWFRRHNTAAALHNSEIESWADSASRLDVREDALVLVEGD
jgi:uncharacterized protein YodC (DUF2158 family)